MKPSTPPPGLAAKYATVCPRCEVDIPVSARIAFLRGQPIHVECANGGDE